MKKILLLTLLILNLIIIMNINDNNNNSKIFAANQTNGFITETFDLSHHDDNGETKLWLPYPISDKNQLISNISVTGDFDEQGVYSDQKYKSPILFAKWKKWDTDNTV